MALKVSKGFSLVGLLIVVIVLASLAAVVIPKFSHENIAAQEADLLTELNSLRHGITLYMVQHNNQPPGTINGECTWENFILQLTKKTDIHGRPGHKFGPYIRDRIPTNPLNNLNSGKVGPIPDVADGTTGWYYNSKTGEIRANLSSYSSNRVSYLSF